MRLTNKLFAQHLGWTFKKHWQVQGKRVPRDDGTAAELLEKFGIQVKRPEELFKTKIERQLVEFVDTREKPLVEDHTHPNWHQQQCHVYGDTNVLLEGVPQAQVLTNTIEIKGYPKVIEDALGKLQLSTAVERNLQNAIMAAHVFDAEQVKLPKIRLPDRPAHNLPRVYGISFERRHLLLTNKLIYECEKLSGRSVTIRRRLIDNATFKTNVIKDSQKLQFNISADKLLTATRPLDAIKGKYEAELPDLFPIKCTITIPKRNIYTEETFYPFRLSINCSHPHTLLLYFNKEKVRNLHGSNVTETQFQSRNLIKAFAAAAARAKQLYGNDLKGTLSKPIVVQSIQSDGRTFHFGIFQLNTLDLDAGNSTKNYFFHQSNMDLFTDCGYRTGKPFLEGYNKDVFRLFNVFYNNV